MIKIYNLNMSLIAYLENAVSVVYEQRKNEDWDDFFLLADEQKNRRMSTVAFVEIFEDEERIELLKLQS